MNVALLLNSENSQKFYFLAIGLSVLIFIWTLSQTYFTIRDYEFVAVTPTTNTVSGHGNRLVNNTLAAKLFGDYHAPQAATPITALNWKLRGIFKSTDRKRSNVIIENSEGQARQYRIGDDVESGIKVHDILNDRVILKRNGQFEALMIDPEKLKQAPLDQQLFDFNQTLEP